jgi:hypothetical protein
MLPRLSAGEDDLPEPTDPTMPTNRPDSMMLEKGSFRSMKMMRQTQLCFFCVTDS